MKKLISVLCVLAMFGFANAQFQEGLTDEVPNLRVNAMGGVYSLIETSNYADFPQRMLTGEEGAWLGRANSGVWGLVRFNLNNFLSLPMPMAWQISAQQNSNVSLLDLFNYIGAGDPAWVDYNNMMQDIFGGFWADNIGQSYNSSNRINSNFAIGLSDNLLLGLGLKMYSNSNSFDHEEETFRASFEHSFWGLETTWGGTMILDDRRFIDASIDLDFWSWDGSFKTKVDGFDEVDQYEEGFFNCDGIMNFGINARYYVTGSKVDYAPYMKFNYLSFESSVDEEVDPDVFEKYGFNGSVFNFTLGSGVHYKPAEGVKVYNEFEFRYQSTSQEFTDAYDEWNRELNQTRMTLLPIYRMGVEITKEIDPKIWWGFNSVQLWGGFNKTFDNVLTSEDYDDLIDDAFDWTEDYTQETFEIVNVTTGAAFQNGNFKFEFQTTVGALRFDEYALNNVSIGLVYMFHE